MRRTQRTRGFTLIELAIVVAIIGVVAALASYSVTRASQRSRFRSGVRDLMGMVTDARGVAIQLAGAIPDARIRDTNNDCPNQFDTNPGLMFNTATNQVTTIVNIMDAAPDGALPFPLNRLPTIEIDCEVTNLQEQYRGNFTTLYAPSALTLQNNGANTLFIGFSGRGMASTLIQSIATEPLAGRIQFTEPADRDSPLTQNILISGSGQVCVESAAWRCANGWRTP